LNFLRAPQIVYPIRLFVRLKPNIILIEKSASEKLHREETAYFDVRFILAGGGSHWRLQIVKRVCISGMLRLTTLTIRKFLRK